MKYLFVLFVVLWSMQSDAAPLDPLTFLRGCWGTTNHDGMRVTEDWFKNSEDMMLGIAQEVNPENQMINHEFLRISWSPENNTISYHPTFNDQPMSFFMYDPRNSQPGVKATFVNPYHVFPRSFSYEVKKEKLTIRLRGDGNNGDPLEVSYELEKEDCSTRY